MNIPIQYSVRISKRAKRVNLRIKPHSGLEVVIPLRFDQSRIPFIVEQNYQWIAKTLERLKHSPVNVPEPWPPKNLELRSLDLTVPLSYQSSNGISDRLQLQVLPEGVQLTGCWSDKELVGRCVSQYLKRRALQVFEPLLEKYALQFDLNYQRVSVRGQRGRWGSCSAKKNISLNYKLLFVPPEQMRYVLLHELAHTRYMNHSARYWAFLVSMESNAKLLDKQLSQSARFVPSWLDGGMG